ncbi:MAG: cytochrome C oxidase subunit II [Rhodospirillales bacterium]|nr:cytochrome C oxidase subunit II [Rhodospirillales bacterium]
MAIFPPSEKVWWNEPVERTEALWIGICLVWAMILFFMMPYWHIVGQQNLSNEAYKIPLADQGAESDPSQRFVGEAYEAKVEAYVAANTIREEGDTGIPVVKATDSGDVYMLGRLWDWYPILELEKGKSYRFHLSSLDWLHGWSLQPTNINIQVHPGYEMIFNVTPTETGEFGVVCNEFCGIGHHNMLGKIYVK